MHPRSQEPTLARPNMARLSVLSRLIWPSACLSSTLLAATSPAARANLQRRRNPLNWKLLQPSHLPTVPRSGSFLQPGHDRLPLPSADTTQRFPWNATHCTIIPGPNTNFVVFVILQIM